MKKVSIIHIAQTIIAIFGHNVFVLNLDITFVALGIVHAYLIDYPINILKVTTIIGILIPVDIGAQVYSVLS
jgi:hypothetical protein